ncbi:MAG: thymidine kinase [Armatimonadetes bacterium 13_1_40CM_3_65_7]|nr:MAG: thymidine kinase [Armatimonadetes bacterium 13_1_40CM_3_65_7]
MFSGKSEELIRRVRRAQIARQRVQVFKAALDDRYGVEQVASHDGSRLEAMPLRRSEEILERLGDAVNVVAVDEAQFLDERLPEVVEELADRGVRVVAPMPRLLAIAESVDKLEAVCMVCGAPASRTQRLVNGEPAHFSDPIIMVGAWEVYEARCREHHVVPGRPQSPRSTRSSQSSRSHYTD